MRYVSFIILLLIASSVSFAQSPHGAKFNLDCQLCHSLENWKVDIEKVKFDHSHTEFELTGVHKNVSCKSCHASLEFSTLKNKTNCVDCHTDIHESTVGQNCARCHTPNTWVVENIVNIHRMSRFPLLGNHSKADCNQCHKSASNLKFEPLGIRCFDCHSSDYFAAKNPDHVSGGFSKDCEQCHDVSSLVWASNNINHSFFPLVEGHALSNCFACHKQNTYAGLSQDCYTCHQANYMSAKSPDHMKMNFQKDCKQCHSLNPGWSPANFTNHDAIYPLIGAHNTIRNQCEKCHSNGYANTPTQCVGCHQSDYNSTTDPNHTSAGFSTDCASCHSNNAWKPSTFDHDAAYFPIYSGKHAGQWTLCSDCHTNQSNYKVFECINCHEHSKSNTDSHHTGVNGYIYQSTACYSCHPRGTSEGEINHALTSFPLTGAHQTVPCQSCHQNGFANTPTDCVSCHQAKYSSAPNHAAQNYPQDCKMCHATSDWTTISFDHNTTTFPLTGAHTTVTCQTCHVTKLAGIAGDCYSCHQTNFSGAANHLSQNYPHDCTLCHFTTSWQGSTFDHSKTIFPLTGAHVTVNCSSCHTTTFKGTSTDCVSCHQNNYNTAPNHSAQNYPLVCSRCHVTADWKTINFNHNATSFPLSGAHITAACQACHVDKLAGIANDCYSCHQTNFNNAKDHLALNYPRDCTVCHTTITWQGAKFDHAKTAFPLTGAHVTVACATCHPSKYTGTPTDCIACHQNNFNSATNHVSQNYPQTCIQCHNTTDWKTIIFNHSTTSFPLSGTHTTITCQSCHVTKLAGIASDCYSCHQANFTAAPNHTAQNYPHDCTLCHSTVTWQGSTFDHAKTAFPLTGAHTSVACASCHPSKFTGTPTTCISCHQSNFNSAPNHTTQSYPQTCEQCHSTADWKTITFNHSTTTFPLTGAHTSVTCQSCHVTKLAGIASDCYSCHLNNFNSAPNHLAQGYPHDCTMCHSTTSWQGSTFDHAKTAFPLTGAHTSVTCSSCHTTKFAGTPTDCISCHQANFNSAPNHTTQNYPQNCLQCHNTIDWKTIIFDHNTTSFPLTGSHTTVTCQSCHVTKLAGIANDCYSCHVNNFNSAPNHSAQSYPHDCTICHSTTSWQGSTFDHSKTAFPLTGAHTTVTCASCHITKFQGTPTDCISCHQANFNAAPNHTAQNYPQNCVQCHNTTDWKTMIFNHSTTIFPLTGAHTTISCQSCHVTQLAGIASDCYSCHVTNYNSAPNHSAQNYPHDCTMCHSTTSWQGATFNHSTTGFPLTGAHTSVACATCHVNGYQNTSPACYSCHQADYQGTTNPNHTAAHFPTTCDQCHTTTAWTPATFDHDGQYFPIYSGTHKGRWSACSDCHIDASNYAVFSCITCHEHSQSNTDSHHSGVRNYVYNATSCYSCHPTGRSD